MCKTLAQWWRWNAWSESGTCFSRINSGITITQSPPTHSARAFIFAHSEALTHSRCQAGHWGGCMRRALTWTSHWHRWACESACNTWGGGSHPVLMSESESCSVMSNSLQPHGLYSPGNSPGQNTGVGSRSLLQRIFPTQGRQPGLPHCRCRFFTSWATRGSPRILEWVDYPFSRGSSWPRNQPGVSCIAGDSFPAGIEFFTRRILYQLSSQGRQSSTEHPPQRGGGWKAEGEVTDISGGVGSPG